MNALLQLIRSSLDDLSKGLSGQLNMTGPMEDLAEALNNNQVPGRNPLHRCSWEKIAWPSRKPLGSWYNDLLARVSAMRWRNLCCPLHGLF